MVSPSPPVTVGTIPPDTLEVGDTATVDLSGFSTIRTGTR